ncbi:cysteine desulfurase family protein [Micrococcus luteus]
MSVPRRLHFDHAATTPIRPCALEAFTAATALPGNPAALHTSARRAKLALEQAREDLAAALDCHPSEVVLTSGGTEADNLAVQGLFRDRNAAPVASRGSAVLPDDGPSPVPAPRPRIVLTGIEHHAVLDTVDWLVAHAGAEAVTVPVDAEGVVDLAAWEAALAADPERTALATLMWANNEVGAVQPVAEAAAIAAAHGVPLHTDAVQAFGSIPVSFTASGVSTLAVSGHKLGAPVGVGALVVRRDVTLQPVLHGGGQERRLRSGTVSVALAAAFAAAAAEAVAARQEEAARLGELREKVLAVVEKQPGVSVTGPRDVDPATGAPLPAGTRRLPGNVHLVVDGGSADALLFALDMAGVDSSSGSACTAGVAEPSHVLLALGRPEADARATGRLTLGHTTTASDVEALIAALPAALSAAGGAR